LAHPTEGVKDDERKREMVRGRKVSVLGGSNRRWQRGGGKAAFGEEEKKTSKGTKKKFQRRTLDLMESTKNRGEKEKKE